MTPNAIYHEALKEASWENPFAIVLLQKLADANPHATTDRLFVLFRHLWGDSNDAAPTFHFAWHYVKFGRLARERLNERTNELMGCQHWWRPHPPN
jgi:hypothetical protein